MPRAGPAADGGLLVEGRPRSSTPLEAASPAAVLHFAPHAPAPASHARRQLYNAALIARLVLTWFPNPPQVIVGPLATVVDPYLNLFRGIIPPIGGTIDLSPILAFVLLDVSAGRLPASPRAGAGVCACVPNASLPPALARSSSPTLRLPCRRRWVPTGR